MAEFSLEMVELENGNIPFEKFLLSLTKKERSEVISMIEELKVRLNNSNLISTKISKHLRDGIFELRVKHFNRISRSLYFFQIGQKIVLTHGFIKKTKSTPNNEIEKAIKYRKIYKRINNEQ